MQTVQEFILSNYDKIIKKMLQNILIDYIRANSWAEEGIILEHTELFYDILNNRCNYSNAIILPQNDTGIKGILSIDKNRVFIPLMISRILRYIEVGLATERAGIDKLFNADLTLQQKDLLTDLLKELFNISEIDCFDRSQKANEQVIYTLNIAKLYHLSLREIFKSDI